MPRRAPSVARADPSRLADAATPAAKEHGGQGAEPRRQHSRTASARLAQPSAASPAILGPRRGSLACALLSASSRVRGVDLTRGPSQRSPPQWEQRCSRARARVHARAAARCLRRRCKQTLLRGVRRRATQRPSQAAPARHARMNPQLRVALTGRRARAATGHRRGGTAANTSRLIAASARSLALLGAAMSPGESRSP